MVVCLIEARQCGQSKPPKELGPNSAAGFFSLGVGGRGTSRRVSAVRKSEEEEKKTKKTPRAQEVETIRLEPRSRGPWIPTVGRRGGLTPISRLSLACRPFADRLSPHDQSAWPRRRPHIIRYIMYGFLCFLFRRRLVMGGGMGLCFGGGRTRAQGRQPSPNKSRLEIVGTAHTFKTPPWI
jgi:hypothetical protein